MVALCVNGHEVPPGQPFCGTCGEPVVPTEPGPGGRVGGARRWLVPAGVVTVAVIAVVATLVLTNSEESNQTAATTPPSTTTAPSTTTITTAATTTTTTVPDTTAPAAGLTLRPDGFGDINLGDPEAQAFDTLVAAFGNPVSDETVPDCPEGAARFVVWGNLLVSMSGGAVVSYSYSGGEPLAGVDADPSTPEGIRIGSTVADLQAAYGDAVTVYYEEFGALGYQFKVGDDNGLVGALSGSSSSDTVLSIGANLFCI